MRVLFVDDDSSVLKQAKIFLEDENDRLDVETAVSASEGLEFLDEDDFDAIVSDYQMPQMDGLEFLRTVREERGSDIPFVVFTGKGREDVAMKALNRGADRYLQKKGDPKSQYGVLAQSIVQEVEHHRAMVELEEREEKYSSVLENIGDLVSVISEEGKILFVNNAHEEVLGYDSEELLDENVFEYFHPEDKERVMEDFKQEMVEGEEGRVEGRFKCKGGSYIWLESSGRYLSDEGVLVVSREITERKKMEEKLRQYKMAVEGSDYLMAAFDTNYNYLFANQSYSDFYQVGEEEILNKNIEEVLGEETFEQEVKPRIDRCLEGERIQYEMKREHSEKGERTLSIRYYPLREDDEIRGGVAVLNDITERKEVERTLSELFELGPDPVYVLDEEARFKEVNKAFCEKSGYDREEIVGKTIDELPFLEGRDREKVVEGFAKRASGEEIPPGLELPYTVQYRTKEGEEGYAEINTSFWREEGELKGTIGIIRDITERKKLEEELREKQEAVESAMSGIVITDLDGVVTYVNPASLEMFGYGGEDPKDFVGMNSIEFVEDEDKYKEIMSIVKEEGEWRGELKSKRKNGEIFDVQLSVSLIEDENGNPRGLLATYIDITERKEMERKLRDSRERLEKIFNTAAEGIVIIDPEGKIVKANKAAADMIGVESSEDLIGTDSIEFVHPDDQERVAEFTLKSVEEEKIFPPKEYRILTRDEEVIYVVASASILYDDSGNIEGFINIFRDITERKEAEEKVKESKEQLEKIFDTAAEGVAIIDLEGKIIDSNKKLAEMGGFDLEDEIIGADAFEFIAPEDRERAEEYFEKILEKGEITGIEFTFLDSQENKYPAELSASIIRDSEGSPVSIMSIMRDITQRKEAEEKEEFLHSLLRHDVRNKLQIIRGYLELVEDYDLSEKVEEYLSMSKEGVDEGVEIIEKVRALREAQEEEVTEVDIGSMIYDVVDNVRGEAEGKGIEIDVESPESGCQVLAGTLLDRVFFNLIENAVQHSKGSKIRIRCDDKGDKFKATIEDDGEGIPDEKKDKIFDKGYTTDEQRGSGLGLFLVKTLLETYDGDVEVKDSELGGTEFDIFLEKA